MRNNQENVATVMAENLLARWALIKESITELCPEFVEFLDETLRFDANTKGRNRSLEVRQLILERYRVLRQSLILLKSIPAANELKVGLNSLHEYFNRKISNISASTQANSSIIFQGVPTAPSRQQMQQIPDQQSACDEMIADEQAALMLNGIKWATR